MSDIRTPLLPDDAHNRALLANTRPANYVPPTPASRYNLVVIGAGPAGLVCAAGAASLGGRVALIERDRMGGDCLNAGCVPSKALIRFAREASHAKNKTPAENFERVMEHVRKLRADVSRADSVERFTKLGVDVFFGQAQFDDRGAIDVNGVKLKFARAAIAIGSLPSVPDIPGLADAGYETNLTIFNRTVLPAKLCIIGGGPIGCELAQAFRRLGSEVTLLQHGPRLLPRDDSKAAAVLQAQFESEGIAVRVGVEIQHVSVLHDRGRVITYQQNGKPLATSCDTILVATGRRVDSAPLNLGSAGIDVNTDGIAVDDFLRTTNRSVYAAGDCCSKLKFTHAADAMARILIRNALFFGRSRVSKLTIPWTTYTDPEIAQVGMTADEAAKHGADVITVDLHDVDRAVIEGQTASTGFARLILKKGSDRILGATLVAPHAGDMIPVATLAIGERIGAAKLASTIFPYPTVCEVWRKLGDAYNRTRLTPRSKEVLETVLRWRR